MSKPAAYTIQLVKKANGALQMKLMIPGYETIMMQPRELRDVAAGIEALFEQARDSKPLPLSTQALSDRVRALEQIIHTNLSANTGAQLPSALMCVPSSDG